MLLLPKRGLKGISRVMLIYKSLVLGVRVGLKSIAMGMSLPAPSVLVLLSLYAAFFFFDLH